MYGRQTETAIAAMSRLAEVYDAGSTRLSAADIASARQLQGPFVAKILTALSQAGLITGAPGPGGGYALARHPAQIALNDVFALFERENDSLACPFGGGVCGQGEPCPLHHKLVGVKDAMDELLKRTTFEIFREAYQDQGQRPTKPKGQPEKKVRESFRASLGKRGRK
ncbi:MAG: Rrf2 family transcriptional regulator [Planctomycetes bacterium]|nr:Rrf2 family transcriptional regulator [Planctomycetota bacterium]